MFLPIRCKIFLDKLDTLGDPGVSWVPLTSGSGFYALFVISEINFLSLIDRSPVLQGLKTPIPPSVSGVNTFRPFFGVRADWVIPGDRVDQLPI